MPSRDEPLNREHLEALRVYLETEGADGVRDPSKTPRAPHEYTKVLSELRHSRCGNHAQVEQRCAWIRNSRLDRLPRSRRDLASYDRRLEEIETETADATARVYLATHRSEWPQDGRVYSADVATLTWLLGVNEIERLLFSSFRAEVERLATLEEEKAAADRRKAAEFERVLREERHDLYQKEVAEKMAARAARAAEQQEVKL